ncbi:MAG TPA: AbrB/MazE/SpoVT family DNA-binding domain-containing protein [Prolixibacteraceae bacterium]|nr:AbrB/MazE/SpoVT family DNA-binding domain-containing protein [Prolixibacteraceae bacterium]
METTIKKWGNSLGLRIPKYFAKQAGVKDGSLVDINIGDDKIIIQAIQQEEPLDVLLDRIAPYNKHGEIETDESIGNEIW